MIPPFKQMKYFVLIALFALGGVALAVGSSTPKIAARHTSKSGSERKLVWLGVQTNQFSEKEKDRFLAFKGANFNASKHLPEYYECIPIAPSMNKAVATLSNVVTKNFLWKKRPWLN